MSLRIPHLRPACWYLDPNVAILPPQPVVGTLSVDQGLPGRNDASWSYTAQQGNTEKGGHNVPRVSEPLRASTTFLATPSCVPQSFTSRLLKNL